MYFSSDFARPCLEIQARRLELQIDIKHEVFVFRITCCVGAHSKHEHVADKWEAGINSCFKRLVSDSQIRRRPSVPLTAEYSPDDEKRTLSMTQKLNLVFALIFVF